VVSGFALDAIRQWKTHVFLYAMMAQGFDGFDEFPD
jgi:hypothetical protein